MLLIRLHDVDQKLSAIMAVRVALLQSEVSRAAVFMEAPKGAEVEKIIKMHSSMAIQQQLSRH